MIRLEAEIKEIITSAVVAVDSIVVDIGESTDGYTVFEDEISVEAKEFITIFSISKFDLGNSEYAIYDAIGIDTIHDKYDKQVVLGSDGRALIWPVN